MVRSRACLRFTEQHISRRHLGLSPGSPPITTDRNIAYMPWKKGKREAGKPEREALQNESEIQKSKVVCTKNLKM